MQCKAKESSLQPTFLNVPVVLAGNLSPGEGVNINFAKVLASPGTLFAVEFLARFVGGNVGGVK